MGFVNVIIYYVFVLRCDIPIFRVFDFFVLNSFLFGPARASAEHDEKLIRDSATLRGK